MDSEELIVVDNTKSNNIENEESFAKGLNFYKLFWIFMIGCFLGVVVETFYCMLQYNRIESRTALVIRSL